MYSTDVQRSSEEEINGSYRIELIVCDCFWCGVVERARRGDEMVL